MDAIHVDTDDIRPTKSVKFAEARETNLSPNELERLPDDDALKSLYRRNHVKVNLRGRYLWLELLGLNEDESWDAIVANEISGEEINYGDIVVVKGEHVFDVLTGVIPHYPPAADEE